MKKVYLLLLLCCPGMSSHAQTTTFNFNGTASTGASGINGTPQTYVVPAGIGTIAIDMTGGKGGWPCCSWTSSGAGGPLSLGGRVQCTMNVTPGQTLYVYVGGAGGDNYSSATQSPGGWNGGGIGGQSGLAFCAGGGGASDIRTSTSGAYATSVLAVAGGGGGGGDFGPVGGAGGGITGGTGGGGACGGGQTGPGCAGANAGTQGQGGSCVCYSAGGGGGGWWGGNGGGSNNGGGGGSSYPAAAGGIITAITHTQGYTGANGNGQVIITPLCSNPAPNTGGASTLCSGQTITFANTGTTGTWSSSTSAASVNPTTGVVTGLAAGVTVISYVVPGGCSANSTVTVSVGPTIASLSNNAPFCSNNGTTLTLTANSPVNATSYAWTGPATITGASTATASVPSAADVNSGTYSLTLTSSSGCVATYTTAVTINLGPTPISGNGNICSGFTSTLSNSISGGTWASSSTTIATISSGGVVTGALLGTSVITYALPGCSAYKIVTVNALPSLSISPSTSATVCQNSTTSFSATSAGSTFAWSGISGATGLSCTACATPAITPSASGNNIYSVTATSAQGCTTTSGITLSVNPVPAAITGFTNPCVGTTTTLTSSAGGTWSSTDPSKASIATATGVLTGIGVGAATISYAYPTGCNVTTVVNVAPAPANITGSLNVCVGLTTNLNHSTAGGTWFTGSSSVASVNASGSVTGLSAGVANITYTLPSGCTTYVPVVVNALPAAISGTPVACVGTTTTLTDAGGGTWSSSAPGIAAINAFGVLSGMSQGNAVITYTLSTGCMATTLATVNNAPAAISGTASVCFAAQTPLSDATPGGTWTSSNTSVATVSASGLITGIAAGTSIITYALNTGCNTIQVATVNPLPALIGGTPEVCEAATTALSNSDAGGTWASSFPTSATVSATGVLSGIAAGNATITYTLPTGCRRTTIATVDPLPATIAGTPVVCVGSTTQLFDFTTGGAWSCASISATVDGSGIVTGTSAGYASVVYTLATGCSKSQTVTINPTPAGITGAASVCVGSFASLNDATISGTWASNNYSIATIDGTGTVTGVGSGNASITYTLPTGCFTTRSIQVNALPAVITGNMTICEGATSALHDATIGGTWSSEQPILAGISATGVVIGMNAGNSNITYTLGTGCFRTRNMTINPTPAAIGGVLAVCNGLTSALTDASAGGTWVSGSAATATISASGVVTAVAPGMSTIIYTLPQGCTAMAQVTVNSLPADITGNMAVCQNATTTLASGTPGGNWSNAGTGYTNISATGVVTGLAAGMEAITYSLPTGCIKTVNVTVNPLPNPIAGNLFVCKGLTSALSDGTTGGTWSSGASAIASVNASGTVTGLNTGNSTITYGLPTGCYTTGVFVVNPLPAAITGNSSVCPGTSTGLSDANSGGTWTSGTPSVAIVDAFGTVTGVAAGTASITYTLSTGCVNTRSMLVDPLPAPINGSSTVCQGTSTGLSDASSGGTWASSATGLATVSASGVVIGLSPGAAVITYTLPTGCYNTTAMVVNAAPGPITGVSNICPGTVTTFSNITPDGVWGTPSPNASVTLTGNVTGISAGTATISYLLGTGCVRTKLVTINPLPAAIGGTAAICPGSSATLTDDAVGGSWSSHQPLIATIDGSGLVMGVASGVTTMTYTLPTGCYATKTTTIYPAVAAISGNTSLCTGTTTTLTSATTGGAWISDNTTTATVGAISGIVSGINAGPANITYSLATGCIATYTINVNASPSSILGVANSCIGVATTLSNTIAGGSWTSSTPAVATIDAGGIVTSATAGTTMFTYTLPAGCMKTALFVVNPMPDVNTLSGGGNICSGAAGVSISTDGSVLGNTYMLKKGTSVVSTMMGTGGAIDFGPYNVGGTYTLTATSAAGCMRDMAGAATVTVLPLVTPGVFVNSDMGDSICAGTSATFTATPVNGGSAPAYQWTVNGIAMAAASSYTYAPANGDLVTVNMTSNAACPSSPTTSAGITMAVIPLLAPSVSASALPGNNVCNGTAVSFHATAANAGTAPLFSWFKNTLHIADGATYAYVPENGDAIFCQVSSNYRCPATNNVPSSIITMTVNNVYVPTVQIIANPGTSVVKGQSVTFTTIVSNEGPAPHYQWYVGGLIIPGANGGTFATSNFNNGDSVTCTVLGSGDCGLMTRNSVVMSVTTTGVAATSISNSDIRLVPNPNNGTFTINGTLGTANDEPVSIEVTDMIGQVVYRTNITAQNGTINEKIQLSNTIANGMYLLNLHTASDHVAFHFVVTQ